MARTSGNLILQTDSYKLSHFAQYPPKTEQIYSYFESRTGSFRWGCHVADKTRAERIEEAARTLCEHYKTNRHYGPTWCVRDLREALALPPDPPGDGWDALRELRDWIADEANGRGFTVDTVFNRIDRLLAAAPKKRNTKRRK